MDEMKSRLHQNLVEQIRNMGVLSDEELLAVIDDCISNEAKRSRMTLYEKIGYRKDLFHAIRGLDILENLLEDPTVTEIMVNGHTNIFIEQAGEIRQYEKTFVSEEKLNDIIQRIVSAANRVVNETTPVVDARLKDGSRINVVLPPVSLVGPVLTVRKFPRQFSMDELVACKTLSEEGAVSLKKLVSARYNLFISGGTGTGKTTFLNALSGFISKKERIITIEDSAELQLDHPNLVRLESRNQNMEGKNAVTIRDLIRTALRMRPDRIIVGEVRSEEAIDMLQAMNTGHDGSLSTGHANSIKDMISRLEPMVLMGMDM